MAGGRGCLYSCFLGVAALAILSLLVLLVIQIIDPTPRYYAAIRSVSSIDSNLEIDMTLSVERRSMLWPERACLYRGTDVAVAYHGVPFAFAAMGGDDVCAPRWKLWRPQPTTVLARGSTLPRFVLDRARHGEVGFTVTFRIDNSGDRGDVLVTCMARLHGDDKLTACDVHYP